MASRRCIQSLTNRCYTMIMNNPNPYLYPVLNTLPSRFTQTEFRSARTLTPRKPLIFSNFQTPFSLSSRTLCSNNQITNSDDDQSEAEESEHDERACVQGTEIGYKVVGPLQESDRVFKPYEPAFAVVQIGSHQFKVSNGDSIFTEKLKYCDINDKLILNRVLMLGSKSQTIIGRPMLPDASVHAVVEEHALDAKVIIFKKKRRKNYRRTKGHRQELTKLRITDIQGIEMSEMATPLKSEKKTAKKMGKVAVAA